MGFTEDYEVVIRPTDGERVGYVLRTGDGWVAFNLLGFALGEAVDRNAATEVAIVLGLASLNGDWWCRAPQPMVETEDELRDPLPEWDWRKMVIVEITPDTASIRPALAWPQEQGRATVISLPATELLRQARPSNGQ